MSRDQSAEAEIPGRLRLGFLLAVLAAGSAPGAEVKTEAYSDGAKHLVYSVDADGRKNGNFKEFQPNGKPKTLATYIHGKLFGVLSGFDKDGKLQLRETYRDGKLHGQRQEFANRHVVTDEMWLDGELLVPKSAAILTADLKAIQSLSIKTVGEPPAVYDKVGSALRDPELQAQREAALRVLMAYRCLCGLPYRDMVLDWTYIARAEAASDLLARLNKGLTHTPENPGMPEADYRLGAEGASHSNLHFTTSALGAPQMIEGLKGFMDDSDAQNIDRVGHRRWCLNPPMLKTGFGALSGNYTAMWAFDTSRTDVPDYDFVAFPPRGLTPVSVFHDHFAWSISLNPTKYRLPSAEQVKVEVQPVRFQPRRLQLEKSDAPLKLEYFHVSAERMGIPGCIIFRPENFHVVAGSGYWVQITGLTTVGGEDAKVGYLVAFMAL